MTSKVYEIVISFKEPSRAIVTITADSEEEAVNKIRTELDGQVEDLIIDSIKKLNEIPEGLTSSEAPLSNTLN